MNVFRPSAKLPSTRGGRRPPHCLRFAHPIKALSPTAFAPLPVLTHKHWPTSHSPHGHGLPAQVRHTILLHSMALSVILPATPPPPALKPGGYRLCCIPPNPLPPPAVYTPKPRFLHISRQPDPPPFSNLRPRFNLRSGLA